MNVRTYFDSQSRAYDAHRQRGILGRLVSKERDAVFRALAPRKRERILDAGCGSGYYSMLLKSHGALPFGIDFSPKMVEQLRRFKIPGKIANIEQFSLGRRFDKVLCAGALEFTKDPLAALSCMRQHLAPHGLFVLLYPRPSLGGFLYKLYHFFHGFSITLFSRKKISSLSHGAGFNLVSHTNVDPITSLLVCKPLAKR